MDESSLRFVRRNTPISLKGRSICLAPLNDSYLDALCAEGLSPSLWQSTTIQLLTRDDMITFVRKALDDRDRGTAIPFVILETASGRLIGSTRFHSIDVENRHLEIGFTWISVPWQRTSVNTEAKYLMLRHAFEVMDYIRVEFRADTQNERSRRALTRIGAREEGVLRNYRISAGRGIRDLAVYSILANEWPQVRSDLEGKLRLRARGE
ncbi:MAG: GNAT family protein [Steroidobacteraceae bacterium]